MKHYKCLNCKNIQIETEFGQCAECGYEDLVEMRLLEIVQARLDVIYSDLCEKNVLLRDEDFARQDPDGFVDADFAATRLDGRLQELQWIKKILSEGE
jgi:DNA-directed RNA polymerase subunit RPC12/RpoP